MKYVLDASVALKWVLPEQDAIKAIGLRDAYRQRVDELVAPDFFRAECGHSLFRAERKKLITPGQPGKLLASMLVDCPKLRDITAAIPRAVALADRLRIGFYDAVYMALAEAEKCELVTADKRLINSIGSQYRYVVDLASRA